MDEQNRGHTRITVGQMLIAMIGIGVGCAVSYIGISLGDGGGFGDASLALSVLFGGLTVSVCSGLLIFGMKTDGERPWWMLHWPSWVALVVFGGAFAMTEPFLWFGRTELMVFHGTRGAAIPVAVFVIEQSCRRARSAYQLSVQTLLRFATVMGVAISTYLHWMRGASAPSIFLSAMACNCLAIGLASLTVLDFIGWLVSRRSKKAEE